MTPPNGKRHWLEVEATLSHCFKNGWGVGNLFVEQKWTRNKRVQKLLTRISASKRAQGAKLENCSPLPSHPRGRSARHKLTIYDNAGISLFVCYAFECAGGVTMSCEKERVDWRDEIVFLHSLWVVKAERGFRSFAFNIVRDSALRWCCLNFVYSTILYILIQDICT